MGLPILQLTLLRAPTHPSSPHRPSRGLLSAGTSPGPDHSIYHAVDQVANTAIDPLTLLRAQGAQSSYICRFMGGEGASERQRDFSEVTQQSGSQAGLTQRPGSTPHCGPRVTVGFTPVPRSPASQDPLMGPSRLSSASHPSLGVDSAHGSCRGALFTLDSGVNLHSNCEEGQDCHLISQMGKLRPREGKSATYKAGFSTP